MITNMTKNIKQPRENSEELRPNEQRYNGVAIYDNADAMKILKVSRRTLQSWRTEGLISFSQIGSKLYYSQQDIKDFMNRNHNKSFK